MKKVIAWFSSLSESPMAGYWVSVVPTPQSELMCFDAKYIEEIKVRVDGRDILPHSEIGKLKKFADTCYREQDIISFDGGKVRITLTEAMRSKHLEVSVLCSKVCNIDFYQKVKID